MRVSFCSEGGLAAFPGLSQPLEIDSARLPHTEARSLHDCLEQSHFFALSDQVSGLPDARTYTISVHDGTRANTVRLSDPLPNAELEALVGLLRQLARRSHGNA